MRRSFPLLALVLAGCGGYGRFTLPPAGSAEPVVYQWQPRAEPVIANLAVDTLNPSVIEWRGRLLNLFSVYDGRTWHTHSATSADGIAWSNSQRVLSPVAGSWEGSYIAANGAAAVVGGEILYYYQAGTPPQVGLARSKDGVQFVRHPGPVLTFGPRGAWDERAVADPYAVQSGGRIYLYYLGEDRARRQSLGLAVSDDGVHFTKHKDSPLLEPGAYGAADENGLGEPAVWAAHGSYWMIYTGRAHDETRRLLLARSEDGVRWQRAQQPIAGDQSWNAKTLCDPTVLVQSGRVRVWFGGGSKAHPAENVQGQIGLAELAGQRVSR